MSHYLPHRAGFSVTGGRQQKARKITTVIEATRAPLTRVDKLLDIGAGSGGIAAALGLFSEVYATDHVDQRTETAGYSFVLADENLPFPDKTFDVAVSNHVIEHVNDSDRHLDEIYRVLKPSGICYLATPNRWWPYEVHCRVVLLHWLPRRIFNWFAARFGFLAEPLNLLSLWELRHKSQRQFAMETWHDRVLEEPTRFAVSLPPWAARISSLLPKSVIRRTRALHPTIIVILRPLAQ